MVVKRRPCLAQQRSFRNGVYFPGNNQEPQVDSLFMYEKMSKEDPKWHNRIYLLSEESNALVQPGVGG